MTPRRTFAWPAAGARPERSILNPFDDPVAAREQLKEAVRRLNDSLLIGTLRFHVSRDGMTAWWEDRLQGGSARDDGKQKSE